MDNTVFCNMDSSDSRVLINLRELEEAAENVLADKQEIVDLDRKRNSNREALSALDKSSKSHWKGDESRTWLTMNNCFIQMKTGTAKELVKAGLFISTHNIYRLYAGLKLSAPL